MRSYTPQKIQCRGTKRDGSQCANMAMLGGLVCRMHGGKNPQVLAKAAERRAELEVDVMQELRKLIPDAIQAMTDLITDMSVKPEVRAKAAESILSRFAPTRMAATVETTQEERDIDGEIAAALEETREAQAS